MSGEPTEESAPESPQPCAPREEPESAPKPRARAPRVKKEPESKPKPRAPRVKKEPVESATESREPADPMLFAGLNDTLKKMVQAERRHRLSKLKFV